MTSAIRFSRSQSQNSQATGSSNSDNNDVPTSGRASQASQHRRTHVTAAAASPEVSEAFRELPSSIPSASSQPASQRTKTTTSSSSRQNRSEGSCQSRRTVSQPAAAEAADPFRYPWGVYCSSPFLPTSSPAVAAVNAHMPVDDEGQRRPHAHDGRRRVCHHHRHHRHHEVFPFAVPNLPWIPPPPLGGVPLTAMSDVNAHLAQYYAGIEAAAAAAQQQQQQQSPQLQPGNVRSTRRSAAAACSSSSISRELDWPTPDQLPLPSVFPMPPRMLRQQSGRDWALFPPPPLPPWWFLQAVGIPARDGFGDSRSSSSNSDGDSDSDGDSYSDESSTSSSRASSPSPHDRHDRASCIPPPPPTSSPPPRHQRPPWQQRQARRYTPPAGSVETPTPAPRGSAAHTTITTAASSRSLHSTEKRVKAGAKAAVPSVSRRARPSGDGTDDAAHGAHRASREGASRDTTNLARPQPARQAFPKAEALDERSGVRGADTGIREELQDGEHRMQHALSTAESYLARIEDLYHRLRHRYDGMGPSPVKAVEQIADQAAAPCYRERADDRRAETEDDDRSSSPQRQQEQRFHYTAVPTREAPPSPLPTSASATYAVPLKSAASERASTSASQSLLQELAVLESQWQRLEELKQHGVGASAAHRPSSHTPQSFSSVSLPTAAGTAAAPSLARGSDVFSNQSVMELINDRKHLLALAA